MLEQRDQQELKLRLTGIWDVGVCVCAQLHPIKFVILWTVALQAPLSVEFSRQEYWSSLPFPPPGNLPDPGTETVSLALAGGFLTTMPPGKPLECLGTARL